MKKYVNGEYIDMTAAEIAEIEEKTAEMLASQTATKPTDAERIDALEKSNAELREALEALLNGVTE